MGIIVGFYMFSLVGAILSDSKKRLGQRCWGWAIGSVFINVWVLSQYGKFQTASTSRSYYIAGLVGSLLGVWIGYFSLYRRKTRKKVLPSDSAQTKQQNKASYDDNDRAEQAYKFLLAEKGSTLEKKDKWFVKKSKGNLLGTYSLEELWKYTGRIQSWKLSNCITDKTTDESKYNICVHCGGEVNRDYRACPTCGEHIFCTHCGTKLKFDSVPEFGHDDDYFRKSCPNCPDYRDQLPIEFSNPNGDISKVEVYRKLLALKGYTILEKYERLVKEPSGEEVILNSLEELKDYTDQKCGLRVNKGDNRNSDEEKYKICIHCDAKVESDYRICLKCGSDVSCTYCGANLKGNNNHCVRCGVETVSSSPVT